MHTKDTEALLSDWKKIEIWNPIKYTFCISLTTQGAVINAMLCNVNVSESNAKGNA